MFDCSSALQRTHPVEDELLNCLVCLGLCKSAAIAGVNHVRLFPKSQAFFNTYFP